MPESTPPPSWKGLLILFLLALGLRLAYIAEMHGSLLGSVPYGIAAYDHSRALGILGGEEVGGVFYHAALYAYFLAGVYAVFGPLVLPVQLIQAGLGAFSCVLLGAAGTRLVSRPVGLLAGALLASYPPAILLDGALQKATIALFLLVLSVFLLARSMDRPRKPILLLAGVSLGLLSLARENALLLLPVAFGWIACSRRERSPGVRGRAALVFAVGALLPLFAVGMRNYAVAGEFVPGASNAGTNLYIGNHTGASGLFEALVPGRGIAVYDPVDARRLAEADEGRELRASEVTRYWMARTSAEIRAAPLSWLALLARKACYLVNAREWAGAYDLQAFRRHSLLLRILGVLFRYGFVVALGSVGMVLAWSLRRRVALLYLFAGTLSLSIVLTFVDPRFRLSLVPLLLPFAAYTLLQLLDSIRRRRPFAAAGIAGSVLVVTGIVHLPTGVEDWSESSTYNKLGLALAEEGRDEEALDMYLRAVEAEPENPSAHFNAGARLLDRGEYERGLEHLETAVSLEPRFEASIRLELGVFWAENGEFERALGFLARARELDPGLADTHFNLGLVLRRLGGWEESEEAYREAIRLDPGHADARNNLAYLLGALGRKEEAIEEYQAALELRPDFSTALVNLAWVLATDAEHRDGPEALRHAERAHALAPSHRTTATLAAAHAACGNFADAVRLSEELDRELRAAGEEALADQGASYLAAYRAGRPWTEE